MYKVLRNPEPSLPRDPAPATTPIPAPRLVAQSTPGSSSQLVQCLINTKQSVACPTKVEECVIGKDKNPDIWVHQLSSVLPATC